LALLAVACKASKGSDRDKARLLAEDPVDETFRGCQKSCGARSVSAPVVLQPNAKLGDYTRCPVSGAAFQVTDKTIQRTYHDRTVFLCCNGCARYFDEHADTVMAVRNI
jgi:hypothetical protein